jgi:hypothetical protein
MAPAQGQVPDTGADLRLDALRACGAALLRESHTLRERPRAGEVGAVRAIGVTPDGRKLIYGGTRGMAHVWDSVNLVSRGH